MNHAHKACFKNTVKLDELEFSLDKVTRERRSEVKLCNFV